MARPARPEQEIEHLRQHILDAASRVFASHGFEAASIEEIAREAGYGASTLYGYFKGKQAIVSAIMERFFEDQESVFEMVLPAGLSYVSGVGTNWTCTLNGQAVTCTYPPPLDPGQSTADLTLTVAVTMPAAPTVTNTASVDSASIEDDVTDNVASASTAVVAPALRATKLSEILSDPYNGASQPKRIPGALVRYAVTVTNSGSGTVDNTSLVLTDPVPAGTSLYVSTAGGPPVEFINGTPASGLSFSYPASVSYSNQPGGGPPYTYVPVPDANGVDANVTGLRVAPGGVMSAASASGNPSFTVRFRVRIR